MVTSNNRRRSRHQRHRRRDRSVRHGLELAVHQRVQLVHGEQGQRGRVVEHLRSDLPAHLGVLGQLDLDHEGASLGVDQDEVGRSGFRDADLAGHRSDGQLAVGHDQLRVLQQEVLELRLVGVGLGVILFLVPRRVW
jgi:hypothetical protein